jgi:hypothetical protein
MGFGMAARHGKLAVRLLGCAALVFSAAASADRPHGDGLQLVTNGHSEYRIVVPKDATVHDTRAAEALRDTIRQISGAELPIVTDREPLTDREIIIGRNHHALMVGVRPDRGKLGREGFRILTTGRYVVIAGGPERGTLYGANALLEEYLGCRWFTPKLSRIPSMETIILPEIDRTELPAMDYRQVYYAENGDHDLGVHLRLNAGVPGAGPEETVNDEYLSGNGLCHTSLSFCSPDEYFATHPEYFCFWRGQRRPDQLCLTNPAVLEIVVRNLAAAIERNPGPKVWNVSQMDNGEPCECPECKALDEREGGHAGTIVNFTNQVAARFPDKTISTLAYWYSMVPPKTIRPAKNVQIIYCIDGDFRGNIESEWEGFAAMSPNLFIWYYCIPCQNIIAPWPNLLSVQRDFQRFVGKGAKGAFVEGSFEPGSEFAELRNYLIAKLLWDPNCDISALIDDYVECAYGPAAREMREYIDTMYGALTAAGDTLDTHCWSEAYAGTFLRPEMLAQYDAIFDRAEAAAASDPEILARVEHDRAPLMHAELQLGYGTVDQRIALVERLEDIAKRTGIPHFADFNERPAEAYLGGLLEDLRKQKAAVR